MPARRYGIAPERLAFEESRNVLMTTLGWQNSVELSRAEALVRRFREVFGSSPELFRAPGRVNLIGEHTDYNHGFVMPAAINFDIYVAVAKGTNRFLQIHSEQFGESITLGFDQLTSPPRGHWSDYVRGVAAELLEAGYPLEGANLLISGEVPLGAGLSSSAAIEVATALALTSVGGVSVPRLELARLCQRAENHYSGARCGIMDQFISCFGKSNHAIMLDCRTLSFTHVPLPPQTQLVICNTKIRHELACGEYNERRGSCERAVKEISKFLPGARALRDVRLEDLERHRNILRDVDYRRCRHIVTENARVAKAANELANENLIRFGELMYQSHASLDKDYEVTCEELNIMVNLARGMEGVYGARMTGGGFGGCTINLVDARRVGDFKSEIVSRYKAETSLLPEVYVCSAADGAGPVSLR
jgi:galactokinase